MKVSATAVATAIILFSNSYVCQVAALHDPPDDSVESKKKATDAVSSKQHLRHRNEKSIKFHVHHEGAPPSAAIQQNGGPPFKNGQVVVSGKPSSLDDDEEIIRYFEHADITVIKAETGREFGKIQKYRNKGKKADLNYIAHEFATPNDPFFYMQWHMSTVQAEQAWDITDGNGTIVAVLDGGVYTTGTDGFGCFIGEADFTDNGITNHAHGTHVAGTVAQKTGNSIGVAGLAPGSCIFSGKVLADGTGDYAGVADGIMYAVDTVGADVINLSLGTSYSNCGDSSGGFEMNDALNHAYSNGVTVVAASGNDGIPTYVSFPACHSKVIDVCATDSLNDLAYYSNGGGRCAPGGNVYADLNGDGYKDGILQETKSAGGSWSYTFYQGTSMACPHVAACAALLKAKNSTLTPYQIRYAIDVSALAVQNVKVLQCRAALDYVSSNVPPVDPCNNDGLCDPGENINNCPNDCCVAVESSCMDGIDNDCDGLVDCDDPDCSSYPACSPSTSVDKYICKKNAPSEEEICLNGSIFPDNTCSTAGAPCENGGKVCNVITCPGDGSTPLPPPPSPPTTAPPTGQCAGVGESCQFTSCCTGLTCPGGKPSSRICS